MARKAAALRCYFSWSSRRGDVGVDPARRLTAPSGGARLPRVLDRGELTAMLDGPASSAGAVGRTAASSASSATEDRSTRAGEREAATRARDDAVLELLYGCGLRVAELCGLDRGDIDVGRPDGHRLGKGRSSSARCRCTIAVRRRSRAGWMRADPLRRPTSPLPKRSSCNRRGTPTRAPRRPAAPGPSLTGAYAPPRPSPQLRHPPARRRCRPACRPGTPRSRQSPDHPGLHSCQQGAAAIGLWSNASPGVGRVGDTTTTAATARLWVEYKKSGDRRSAIS